MADIEHLVDIQADRVLPDVTDLGCSPCLPTVQDTHSGRFPTHQYTCLETHANTTTVSNTQTSKPGCM